GGDKPSTHRSAAIGQQHSRNNNGKSRRDPPVQRGRKRRDRGLQAARQWDFCHVRFLATRISTLKTLAFVMPRFGVLLVNGLRTLGRMFTLNHPWLSGNAVIVFPNNQPSEEPFLLQDQFETSDYIYPKVQLESDRPRGRL